MILKIFLQPNCPKCPEAKKLGKEIKKQSVFEGELKVKYFDTLTVDGLAEASFYSVMAAPSLILSDEQGKEIKGWRGDVPTPKEIIALLR